MEGELSSGKGRGRFGTRGPRNPCKNYDAYFVCCRALQAWICRASGLWLVAARRKARRKSRSNEKKWGVEVKVEVEALY